MRVYRLCREKHAATLGDAFRGAGAEKRGGRWNPKGTYAVYTSETASLALLEMLAHADLEDLPGDLVYASVTIPEAATALEYSPRSLPDDWRETDPSPKSLVDLGGKWLSEGEHFLLRVPSIIIPTEYNVIINPHHPDAALLSDFELAPFTIDPRLGVGLKS